ncbi:cell surface ecto-5'-nucleotidase Nt5e [Streptococcus ratti]|uniref:5'-nucleotidase n=1 Tax=Streptococcus ratti FA-1 = DSM 20564 TaxID=699248 RepID=A0ABN0GV15_STRRT|nr:cell surface ecto-5'-nucleotidase Nt5e [Streptococcus ratti]EJN94033.1 putative 5'-nucleotidase precursor [Streptococcus ratti FA-1 = DSM 20564]EMP70152.1 putative 5'-nucleotidase precursor [Streptococcus ratti FA-1 = DSM 20564]QEY07866.1 bifunctional metallophosphatase/5'-nucleotidase [Streptococcus ratti]VEI60335.1 putative 5'-nucleotidase precursor [Streptococcus mutans]
MKRKALLVPTLFLSTALLSMHAYADETSVAVNTDSEQVPAVSAQTEQIPDESVQSNAVTTAVSELAEPDTASQPQTSVSSVSEEAAQPAEELTSSSEPARIAAPASDSRDDASVTILHTNDIHGRFLEDSGSGVIGMPKLAGLANDSRQQGTTLLLDSGDATQGLPITNNSQGTDAVALMNAAGYDAMTVGNHEFDFGLNQLKTLSQKMTFPIISSNIYVNGVRLFEASTVIDKNKKIDGDEYVVIGVTTPETATKTHPRNVVGVTFTDPITEVNNVIAQTEAQARAEGKSYQNYIILAHLGVDTTTKSEWRGDSLAQALAKNSLLAGKNVIVLDGHSHTAKTAVYGNVIYNQTGSYLNNVGLIKLNSKEVLSNALLSAEDISSVQPDPTVQAMVDKIDAAYKADSATVVIPNSPVELNGERTNVRVRETNLGNAVADALLDYGQTGFSHKSHLAVTNGGGLRETIARNKPVTKGDIIAVLPFGNTVSQIAVKGQSIKDMFLKSLGSILQVDSQGNPVLDENAQPLMEPSGGFLQVAGAKVYYDTNLKPEKRILHIDILDPESKTYKPLDTAATYYLVTNDFLAAGGDGYTMLGGSREEGPSMDTVFADYLAKADLTQYAVINPNSRLISLSSVKDSDGDGFTDLAEALAGTSFKDPKSYPNQAAEQSHSNLPEKENHTVPMALLRTSEPVKLAVRYQRSQKAALSHPAYSYQNGSYRLSKRLPQTNGQESAFALLAGISLMGYGLYGIGRKTYRK